MQKAQPLVPVPQPGLQVLEKSPLDQWWRFRVKNPVEPRKMVALDNKVGYTSLWIQVPS